MNIIYANDQNFNELISKEEVLVDFFATWCGPCKMLNPVLEDLSNDRSSINVVKVDVDENPNLARSFGVMSVPTLILFRNGKEISKQSGYMPKEELIDWINENN